MPGNGSAAALSGPQWGPQVDPMRYGFEFYCYHGYLQGTKWLLVGSPKWGLECGRFFSVVLLHTQPLGVSCAVAQRDLPTLLTPQLHPQVVRQLLLVAW